VYVAGAGPAGLACSTSAHLLGAAVVIVGDMNPERLRQAASFGCETIDLSATDDLRGALGQILGGSGEVDAAVDCVGFEARGHGREGSQGEAPATVLNSVMDITRAAGRLGIPGLYVTGDPGAVDEPAKVGSLSIRIGLGWAKSHSLTTGQCPVMRYDRQLMMAIPRAGSDPSGTTSETTGRDSGGRLLWPIRAVVALGQPRSVGITPRVAGYGCPSGQVAAATIWSGRG
jgi:glutathione-independent formaldehyde dehydrogenase